MATLSLFICAFANEVMATETLESVYGKITESNSKAKTFTDVIKDVKNGNVDKADLDVILALAKQKNPEAVELLAWMNATGKGTSQNFYNAWFLYMEADELGVPEARKNADVIYNLITFQGGKE